MAKSPVPSFYASRPNPARPEWILPNPAPHLSRPAKQSLKQPVSKIAKQNPLGLPVDINGKHSDVQLVLVGEHGKMVHMYNPHTGKHACLSGQNAGRPPAVKDSEGNRVGPGKKGGKGSGAVSKLYSVFTRKPPLPEVASSGKDWYGRKVAPPGSPPKPEHSYQKRAPNAEDARPRITCYRCMKLAEMNLKKYGSMVPRRGQ